MIAANFLVACSSSGTNGDGLSALQSPVTQDAATRAEPVVAGRRARVFIFAGLGNNCEQLLPPEITILQEPSKGALSFASNQQTSIGTSTQGTCIGRAAMGTGLYYTAREGADGTDRFSVSATLAGGETITRMFEVTITQ